MLNDLLDINETINCVKCGKTQLNVVCDDPPPSDLRARQDTLDDKNCLHGHEHELNMEVLNNYINKAFIKLTEHISYEDKDKVELGIESIEEKQTDDMLRTLRKDKSILMRLLDDIDYRRMTDNAFPQDIMISVEEKEREEIDFFENLRSNVEKEAELEIQTRLGMNESLTREEKIDLYKRIEKTHLERSPKFSKNFPEEIIENPEDFQELEVYVDFIDRIFENIIKEIISVSEYKKYLETIIGEYEYDIDKFIDKIKDKYEEKIMNIMVSQRHSKLQQEDLFNNVIITKIIKSELPLIILSDVSEQHYEKFIDRLTNIKLNNRKQNSEYIKFIKRYLLIKALNKNNSINMMLNDIEFNDRYLRETTKSSTYAIPNTGNVINMHDYDVALDNIYMNYSFLMVPNTDDGSRMPVMYGDKYRREEKIYDFLHLYMNMKVTQNVRKIVYKHGDEDYRCKTFKENDDIPGEDEICPIEIYSDYLAIYYHKDDISAKVIVDLLTAKCYIYGVISTIKDIQKLLETEHGILLKEATFLDFRGVLRTETKANLTKKNLKHILKLFGNFWTTKNINNDASNYVFVSDKGDETENKQTETSKYVTVKPKFVKKTGTLTNSWDIEFDGNFQPYLLPFIVRMIALIEFLDNLLFNEEFKDYRRAETEMLQAHAGYIIEPGTEEPRSKLSSSNTFMATIASFEISKIDSYITAFTNMLYDKNDLKKFREETKPIATKSPFVYKAGIEDIIFNQEDSGDIFQGIDIYKNRDVLKSWVLFYFTIEIGKNMIFSQKNNPSWKKFKIIISEIDNNYEISDNDFKNDEMRNILKSFKVNGFDITHNRNSETGMKSNKIAIINNRTWFLEYPERGKIHGLLMVGVPVRQTKSLLSSVTIERKKLVSGTIQDMIANYTEAKVESSIRLDIKYLENALGKKSEKERSFYEFLMDVYKRKETIELLLSQHMWDVEKEDLEEKLQHINISLQQDLIQHLLDARILYFEYNTSTKDYKFVNPRHRYWYAISDDYEDVIFIFKTLQEKYEIIQFAGKRFEMKEKSRIIPRIIKLKIAENPKIRDLYKGITLGRVEKEPIVLQNIAALALQKYYLKGQFIDSNGKCFGFRFKYTDIEAPKRDDGFLELRINPQAPVCKKLSIIDLENNPNYLSSYSILTDSKNTYDTIPIANDNNKWELFPKKTTTVKYRITEMYNKEMNSSQNIYIFFRMTLSAWIIWVKEQLPTRPTFQQTTKFISNIIANEETRPPKVNQDTKQNKEIFAPIESAVMLPYYEKLEQFMRYLEIVHPRIVSQGKFYVPAETRELIIAYTLKELTVIHNYPNDFLDAFLNSRMKTKFMKEPDNQIIGTENAERFSMISAIREKMVSEPFIRYVERFEEQYDPSVSKSSVTLLILPYKEKVYLIRFTKAGDIEIAQYICHLWHTKKEIASYEELTMKTTTRRLFNFDKNRNLIEESKNNSEEDIKASGQDYHVLQYHRQEDDRQVFVAMLPLF